MSRGYLSRLNFILCEVIMTRAMIIAKSREQRRHDIDKKHVSRSLIPRVLAMQLNLV